MRTFIAIEISEEIREKLTQIEAHLKYSSADVKWVVPGNIHLTLKFLGEIDEGRIEKIKAILDEIGRQTKPFEISIKELGTFPKIDLGTGTVPQVGVSTEVGTVPKVKKTACPRVIWVGLDKGALESAELAKKIDENLSKLGFEKESRPFAAHLTIGRVRSSKNKAALKEKIESFQLSAVSFQLIKSITLFKSTLTPSGSIYTKIHESKLV